MKKTNILFMQSQTYFGADSRIHSLLMRYLDRARFNVHVACNTGTGKVDSAAARALRQIPELRFRSTHFGPTIHDRAPLTIAKAAALQTIPGAVDLTRLVQYVRSNHIDIIHCTEKPRDAFYGLLLARLSSARCLIHLHVKVEDWMSPLTRWAMRQADALVGVSRFVARSAEQKGYAPGKTTYVWNALETEEWDASGKEDSIRAEFDVPRGAPLLLTASRLIPWKGHRELLQALAAVKEAGTPFRLLIVGEDDPRAYPGTGSYEAELESLCDTLNLQDEVIFAGYRNDMPRLMHGCDIFAMPSFEEPFGMVYLEAMAMRKPIIALDNGGAKEIVEHGKSGLLSQPGDVEQLADNILELLSDRALQQQVAAHGYRRLCDVFTPDNMTDRFQTLYRRLAQDLPVRDL